MTIIVTGVENTVAPDVHMELDTIMHLTMSLLAGVYMYTEVVAPKTLAPFLIH